MIETKVSDYPTLALYIDGKWLTSASGGSRAVVNPTDESVLALLPLAGAAELEQAVAAAQRGFALWKSTTASERHETLTRATRLLRERAERIAQIMTLEKGKPLADEPVTFVDTRNNKRDGKLLLKPVQTVVNGVPFGRPYQAPFAVR